MTRARSTVAGSRQASATPAKQINGR
jgi:hypothetical protein